VTETNIFQLSQPGAFVDPLTEVLRNGRESATDAGRRGGGGRPDQLPCRRAHR
jgi:hypothetical protein